MPARPSGLPRATISPCSRWTRRTTATSLLAEHAVDVGQRVLAAGRVEQVRAGDVAQAVAQRDETSERPDVRGRERHAGIGGAQLGGGEVEDEVVRADGDDRAVDLADPAQQRDVDVLARVVALEPGGHDEQAVRAHERREHAGAARQRRRHELAADASEPDAHPVVHAHRRRELAREPRAGARVARPASRPRAPRAAARRRCRTSATPRPGSRARRAPACASTAPSTTGWPGPDRHAVDRERAEPLDDARPCGRRARRSTPRPTITRSARAAASRTAAAIASGSSGTISPRHAVAAGRLGLRDEHERVRVEDHAGRRLGADRADLVAGRQHRDDRRAVDEHVDGAGGRRGGDVDRPQAMALGQQQLGGADVLADRAHVLVGRDGAAQLRAARRRRSGRARA